MIGESLSPTPRQRAEEILRRLAPVEREALLVKCWMSHDGRWFMAAARECGMEGTSSPRYFRLEEPASARPYIVPPVVALLTVALELLVVRGARRGAQGE